jgi:hypothetical protein
MIGGVTVVGDLMRPSGDGAPGGTDRMTAWVRDALAPAVRLAAGLPTDALTTAGAPDLHAWIEILRPQSRADAFWASVHADLPASAARDRLVLAPLRNRFCIGYEMPPWLVRLLDQAEVPYIDIRLHPVRFMDDLMFAVRAASPATQAVLAPLAVAESEVAVTAGLRQAMGAYISQAAVPDNTLLVAGQRRFDSTQVTGGRFFDATDHIAAVHAICAGYSAVVLKPHPLDLQHSLLVAAATAPARVLGVIDDNIYRMMALPQIAAILTVNSGVAQEAPYFGKRVHALAPLGLRPAWRETPPAQGTHLAVTDIVLTPDFWRLVLAPHARVTPPDGMRLPPKPNRLRIALDSFWNYQQIDTDRIPRA